MAFNIMSRNCDDHTKNVSFLLKQSGTWELAPAYDVTFAHNPESEWTNQHLMSVNGKFKGFAVEDIFSIADRFGIGEASKIIKDVRAAVQEWLSFAASAGVKKMAANSLKEQHVLLG